MISTMISTVRTMPTGVPCVVPAAAWAEGGRTLKACGVGELEAQGVLDDVAAGDLDAVGDVDAAGDVAAAGVQVEVAAGWVVAPVDVACCVPDVDPVPVPDVDPVPAVDPVLVPDVDPVPVPDPVPDVDPDPDPDVDPAPAVV